MSLASEGERTYRGFRERIACWSGDVRRALLELLILVPFGDPPFCTRRASRLSKVVDRLHAS